MTQENTMTSKSAVDSFLAQPALARVGMSRSGRKFGNLAYRELTTKGYRVYPIHPTVDTIEGSRCYRRFADLPEPVDAALVVVPPAQAARTVREAAAAGLLGNLPA
jgi:predicted CoA-binding protein